MCKTSGTSQYSLTVRRAIGRNGIGGSSGSEKTPSAQDTLFCRGGKIQTTNFKFLMADIPGGVAISRSQFCLMRAEPLGTITQDAV